jgi:Arc/MetJ family transcription regulator
MRITVDIDDQILKQASELTGVTEKTALVRKALETLIARNSARRLADLGGTERNLRPIRRRNRTQ